MSPFGAIEQRELLALRGIAAFTPAHVAAIVAVRARCDGSGWTHDGLASLAALVHMTPRSMSRALSDLKHLGLLEARAVPRKGGSRGVAWTYDRRVVTFDELPKSMRDVASSSDKSAPQDAPSSVKSTPPSVEEDAKPRGRGRQTTRHIPKVPPKVFPKSSDDDLEIEETLDELRAVDGYPFDETRDQSMLARVHERRPGIQLLDELEAWVSLPSMTLSDARAPRSSRLWEEQVTAAPL